MRNFIEPASWDESPQCQVAFWEALLLVNQGAAAHEQIGELLDAMGRALR